jgi:antitoxin component of MazEF toxin-antitoxin module
MASDVAIAKVTRVVAPVALIYDNRPEEVDEHTVAARDRGFTPMTVTRLPELIKTVRNLQRGSKVFLDQHNAEVLNLSSIGFPKISTDSGLNVGLALARGVLPDLTPPGVDVYIMSMFELEPGADVEIEKAIARGQVSRFVKKRELSDFLDALQEGTQSESSQNSFSRAEVTSDRHEDYRKRLESAILIANDWTGSNAIDIMAIFGWPDRDPADYEEFLKTVVSDFNSDVSARSDAIRTIKRGLLTIYRDRSSIEREQKWLNTPDRHLDGQSPWHLILSSEMAQLARVAGLVGRLL